MHPMLKFIALEGPMRSAFHLLLWKLGYAAVGPHSVPRPAFMAELAIGGWSGAGRLWNFSGTEDGKHSLRPGFGNYGKSLPDAVGGTPSLSALYRKHGPALYWVCMRYTRSREDAEDMVQQVFVKAHRNLDGFRGQSSVYTWLYRIAVNECLDLFRRRKFQAEGNVADLEHLLPVFPEGEMDARLDLRRIVAETDPQTMEILFLLYLEGLTQEEVVEVMGVSRSMINRKISAFKSGRERFR